MFSRREWLMIIAILLMIESWILNISYSFHTDQGVINYISFASTIASLLLAILAIIYGFYQADGQKKSTSVIETQLGMMGTLQDSVKKSSDDIEKSLYQMQAVSETLKSIPSVLEGTLNGIGKLQQDFEKVVQSQDLLQKSITEKNNNSSSNAPSTILDKYSNAAKAILTQASFEGDVISYAMYKASKNHPIEEIPFWKFVSDYLGKPLGSKNILSNDISEWRQIGIQYILILKSIGCLELISNPDVDSEFRSQLKLTADFKALLNQIEESRSASDMVKPAYKILDEFSWT